MPVRSHHKQQNTLLICALLAAVFATAGQLATTAHADFSNARTANESAGLPLAFDAGFTYSVRETRSGTFSITRRASVEGRERRFAVLKSRKITVVNQLMAGGGQVAVELIPDYKNDDEVSRVFRTVAGKVTPIGTLQDPMPAGICAQSERLVDVLIDGRIVVESNRMEGLNGACDVQRLRQTVTAVGPDGAMQVLRESVSPWGVEPDGQQSTLAISGSLLFTNFPGNEITTANLATGAEGGLPYAVHKRFWELSQDGRMLTTQPVHKLPQTNLYTNAADLTSKVVLATPGQVSFFHFCGSQILEVSRVGKRQSIKDGRRYWSLARRDLGGVPVGTIKHRLARGTNFVGCDGRQAVFNKPFSNDEPGGKLFAVSLLP